MRFYALTTKAMSERMVCDDLKRLGFDHVVAPLISKTIPSRRNKAKTIVTLHPFFRGYVFVGLHPDAKTKSALFPLGWHEAERAMGALRFVRFGAGVGPSPLPVGFVEAFRDAMNAKGVINAPHATAAIDPLRARIEAGRAVKLVLKEGVFAGFKAETEPLLRDREIVDALARLDTRGRVAILVSMFGRITSMEVDREQVELLESDHGA